MELQEAIEHIDEVIEDISCENCKNEHLQLKEWLIELLERRSRE